MKQHGLGLTFALMLSLMFPAWAAGEESAPKITLGQVIEDALRASGASLDASREKDEKEADALEATTIENPELQVDLERVKNKDGAGVAAEFFQPLKLSQLSGERSDYASSIRRLAESEQKIKFLVVINEASTAYVKLWALQARKALYERSIADSNRISGLIDKATHAGQTARAAQELFKGDNEQLGAETKALEAEIGESALELSRLTGKDLRGTNLAQPEFSSIPPTAEPLIRIAENRTTWRTVLKDRIDSAQRRLEVAETDGALPEFGPRLVYSRSPDGVEEAVGVGVALRIPLWNQNDAEKQRARSDLNYARNTNATYQGFPPAETIRSLHRIALVREQRREKLQKAVLPRYRKSYELTQAMFREGQENALGVWQVREKLYQTEETALAAVVEAYSARLKLESEIGGKIEEIAK